MRLPFLLLLTPLALLAQQPSAPSETNDTLATTDLRARRAAALAAVRARDGDRAEVQLGAKAEFANQPHALVELATDLLRVAFDARALGDLPAAQLAAARALRLVERTERLWADQPTRLAELLLLRATLMEEFLGTSDDAEALVKRAHELDPENPSAAEKARKLSPPHE